MPVPSRNQDYLDSFKTILPICFALVLWSQNVLGGSLFPRQVSTHWGRTDSRKVSQVKGHGFKAVQCMGKYSGHLQGICTNEQDAIYWCFTETLVKTNPEGQVLKQVRVANHHGDLCYHEGKVYVAVNLGKFNDPQGNSDSWIYVYDGESLSELARHRTPEVFHGAGGIAHHRGRFIIVGGLPKGVSENYVYEYREDFTFVQRHVVTSGYTLMGVQTAAYARGFWWFGCYGNPKIILKVDDSFRLVGKYRFDGSLGVAGLPDGRFLVGRGECETGGDCTGSVVIAGAISDE